MDLPLIMYKLVDVLKTPITIQGGKVSGHSSATITLAPGITTKITVKVLKMFSNEQVGVLAHIRGDLFILVSYNPNGGGMSAYLIDGTKCYSDEGVLVAPTAKFSTSNNLRQVVESMKPAIVAAFFRKSGDWGKLSLPS